MARNRRTRRRRRQGRIQGRSHSRRRTCRGGRGASRKRGPPDSVPPGKMSRIEEEASPPPDPSAAILQQYYDQVDQELATRGSRLPKDGFIEPVNIRENGFALNVRFEQMRHGIPPNAVTLQAAKIFTTQIPQALRGKGGMTTILKKIVDFARNNHYQAVTIESVNPSSTELIAYLAKTEKRAADGLGFQLEPDMFSFDDKYVLLL